MKKMFVLGFAFLALFVLTACDSGGKTIDESTTTTAASSTDYVQDIVAVLESNGYVLTTHDESSRTYFHDNTLVATYSIDCLVTDLIMGDVSGNDWVQLVGLETEQDAIDYAAALEANDNGELVYQNGNAVLLTYSQTALDLFE
ncbi:MAG: hypothetical protein JXL85_08080 [Bacilli bacterium]|nr:hypothetical protein [Bacilli bacterium]